MSRLGSAFSRRAAREGTNAGLQVAFALAVLAGANYVADRRNVSWDATEGGQHSLSGQTLAILGDLTQDVRLVVLDRPGSARAATGLFQLYADRSDRVSFAVIDPDAEPARALPYQGETGAGVPLGTVVVESGDRRERVRAADEQSITNAMIRLIGGESKRVLFTTGHDERGVEDSGSAGASVIRGRLEESNYEVATLSLLETVEDGRARIPEDAAAIVAVGPRRDFLEAETEALSGWVRAGGRFVLLMDPPHPPGAENDRPNLTSFLEEFGVSPAGDVVIDGSGVGQLFGFGAEAPLAASYGFHPITRGFGGLATVFPVAQSLIVAGVDDRPAGLRPVELASTSDASWGEFSASELGSGEVAPGPEDRSGPLALAWAVSIDVEDADDVFAEDEPPAVDEESELFDEVEDAEEPPAPEGRLVVVGDADFIANDLALAPLGNADLFLNMVNWATEDEDLIAIRPRDPEDRRIAMTARQAAGLRWFSVVLFPGFFLIWGGAVWWSRR